MNGTADNLSFEKNKFDLIIFGFCLYLCDPIDYFKIVYEIDRVLMDLGNIMILDFNTPLPYKNNYKHNKKMNTYKMDFSKLFSWNSFYTVVISHFFPLNETNPVDDIDNRLSINLIKKNINKGFIKNPFK